MPEDDDQENRHSRARRSNPDDMSRYEVIVGKEEISREVRHVAHEMSLISRDEVQRMILEAAFKANSGSIRRWHNVNIVVSTDAENPGIAEAEFRDIIIELRALFKNKDRMGKIWRFVENLYDEAEQSRGSGVRNASVIAAVISTLVTLAGTLWAIFGHK